MLSAVIESGLWWCAAKGLGLVGVGTGVIVLELFATSDVLAFGDTSLLSSDPLTRLWLGDTENLTIQEFSFINARVLQKF